MTTAASALVLGRTGAAWPGGAKVAPVDSDTVVAVALRSLGVTKRAPFADLFDRPWVLNPDGCGYRALLASLAASMQRTIHVVAEVQGATFWSVAVTVPSPAESGHFRK